ncbi:MAG: hypothetical protein NT062_09645 [Proteobacteria bacterium]|nr:hypothetical protein [Pseudomonadota bacterium]
MKRLSIISLVVACLAFAACGKKPADSQVGSGSSATPPVAVVPTGSGSGSGSAAPVVNPGEKLVGKSPQLTVVELVDKATPTGKQYQVRGDKGAFTLDVVGGPDVKDTPDVTEFPISTPDHKNMNSTTVSFPFGQVGALQLSVASFGELAKPGAVTPELIKAAFDRSQNDSIAAMQLKLDKATDETIAGAPGRTIEFSGEVPIATGSGHTQKAAGKAWMVFLAKANQYLVIQVLSTPGSPLLGRAEEFVKTLSIVP